MQKEVHKLQTKLPVSRVGFICDYCQSDFKKNNSALIIKAISGKMKMSICNFIFVLVVLFFLTFCDIYIYIIIFYFLFYFILVCCKNKTKTRKIYKIIKIISFVLHFAKENKNK